jgi:ferredoxin
MMDIEAAKLIYFSPTETTKRVVEGIAQGIPVGTIERIDLTRPETKTQAFEEIRDTLAIIGAPVYGGRIPGEAAHRLRRLQAHDAPAVVVVVYGNREYEDALLELRDIAVEAGFTPIAGGAFIGANTANYSLDDDTLKIAEGRPDARDLEIAAVFGRAAWERARSIRAVAEIPPLGVPGGFPYIERGKPPMTSPATQATLCARCGTCAKACPTGAISVGDKVITEEDACIMCCACVKYCPTSARVCDHTWMKRAGEWLSANYRDRKEPETFV